MSHTTNQILMIRPVRFGFNPETAVNNSFQIVPGTTTTQNIHEKAIEEFDTFVSKLRTAGVSVTVIEDSMNPHTPDSIYPNNWISFHKESNTICLFPMFAPSRRLERKAHVLDKIDANFQIRNRIDFSDFEKDGKYLEGTGSMVLDRVKRKAYACISQRTDKTLLEKFCSSLDYIPISFSAVDKSGMPIYHTNVLMSIADQYAIVCLESIPSTDEQRSIRDSLEKDGKFLIPISYDQMKNFAGNMLQVNNDAGNKILVMSTNAYRSLTQDQIKKMESFGNSILHSDLSTIEANGGGSARCMLAEIFLQPKILNA